MVLHFNATKEERKTMVKVIEDALGVKAKYMGVPSCAYEAGGYRIEKDGTISWPDLDDADPTHLDQNDELVNAISEALGRKPEEWQMYEEWEGTTEENDETGEDDRIGLTVTLPLEKVNVGNLTNLLEAKGDLIKKALGIENLGFKVSEDSISFPWFGEIEPDAAMAYTKFIGAICEMTINQKRITSKPRQNENEKYTFRCFLLRLGFIGDEYKSARKILLSKLEGSSAFRDGAKKGGDQ